MFFAGRHSREVPLATIFAGKKSGEAETLGIGDTRCLGNSISSRHDTRHHVRRFINPRPGTRSRRCENHDYRGGAYFVTTNTKDRAPLFGAVERGRMHLNARGKIVMEEWQRTGDLRAEVSLDTFIVMPDHVHGLLWISHSDAESEPNDDPPITGEDGREARHSQGGNSEGTHSDEGRLGEEWSRDASRDSLCLPPGLKKRRAGTLSTIMGFFKAAVTRHINEQRDASGETIWQSSFHDHIVRNRKELLRIRRYIRANPQEWSRSD